MKYLKKIGAYAIKVITANKAGVADILCCVGGVFCAFEVKTAKGKPSPLQLYHQDLVKKSGGKAAIVRSVDDVKNYLSDWGLA